MTETHETDTIRSYKARQSEAQERIREVERRERESRARLYAERRRAAGEEVHERALRFMDERGERKYVKAMNAVLARDPELTHLAAPPRYSRRGVKPCYDARIAGSDKQDARAEGLQARG